MSFKTSLISNPSGRTRTSNIFFFFPQPAAGDFYPHAPPEVPEGGGPRHHQGGDPRGGADGGRWRDRPRRDGAAARPNPLVQRSEPHPDTGTSSRPEDGSRPQVWFVSFLPIIDHVYILQMAVWQQSAETTGFPAAEFLRLRIEWFHSTHQAELSAVRGKVIPMSHADIMIVLHHSL